MLKIYALLMQLTVHVYTPCFMWVKKSITKIMTSRIRSYNAVIDHVTTISPAIVNNRPFPASFGILIPPGLYHTIFSAKHCQKLKTTVLGTSRRHLRSAYYTEATGIGYNKTQAFMQRGMCFPRSF